jgi:hypothetical protein
VTRQNEADRGDTDHPPPPDTIAVASGARLASLLVRMAAIRPVHDEFRVGLRLAGAGQQKYRKQPHAK